MSSHRSRLFRPRTRLWRRAGTARHISGLRPPNCLGLSRPLASLTAARCSGAADALWAWPQFGMVVPHRSQARLRLSLVPTIRNSRLATLPLASLLCSLDFRFACFAHCARRSSVPIGLTTRCFAHRARASCAPRASSRFAAFDCALRFASCARHSSPSGLRCSQAHSRLSLLHWAHRRLLHPQFAMVVLLRPTACSTPLLIGLTTACFAHCARRSSVPTGLTTACFRHRRRPSCAPQSASPPAFLNSAWSSHTFAPPCANACAVFRPCGLRFAPCPRGSSRFAASDARKLACGTPCFIGLTSACFAHCARPPCAPRPSTPSGLRRAYFALLRAQRARFVRPFCERGAFWIVLRRREQH